jgi:hypothetical protein
MPEENNTTTTDPGTSVLWENPDMKIPAAIRDLVNQLNEQLRMAAEDGMEVDLTIRCVGAHDHGNASTKQFSLGYTIRQVVGASP